MEKAFLIDSVYRIVIIPREQQHQDVHPDRLDPYQIMPKKPNQKRLARGPRLLIYQCRLIKSSFLVPSFLFRSLSRPGGAWHPLSLAAPARSPPISTLTICPSSHSLSLTVPSAFVLFALFSFPFTLFYWSTANLLFIQGLPARRIPPVTP